MNVLTVILWAYEAIRPDRIRRAVRTCSVIRDPECWEDMLHPPNRINATIRRNSATTVQQNDHAAAAIYLMKHAGASALVVLDSQTDKPIGLITEADIAHAVAHGKDMNEVRIRQLMTTSPSFIGPMTGIHDAARAMTSGRFRHLPVIGDAGAIGMVDITDVCQALLDPDIPRPPAVDATDAHYHCAVSPSGEGP